MVLMVVSRTFERRIMKEGGEGRGRVGFGVGSFLRRRGIRFSKLLRREFSQKRVFSEERKQRVFEFSFLSFSSSQESLEFPNPFFQALDHAPLLLHLGHALLLKKKNSKKNRKLAPKFSQIRTTPRSCSSSAMRRPALSAAARAAAAAASLSAA